MADKPEIKKVVCAVSWRRRGGAVKEHGDAVQVEELLLGVEAVEGTDHDGSYVLDTPYINQYIDQPWREARLMVEGLHNMHQNHYEILSIEPLCRCLGPCRYTDRTRFWIKRDGVGFFPAALIDRDKGFERDGELHHDPIAAGSVEDMELLLVRHRRSNHHQ
ncbi:hypothetical protein [Saccharothrix sp. ST-888]|uniref:hypothetical protein n=1 Tax=Saccharothrix sp. ST-888 TaxID=1427391 RepID=UPI0005ECEB5B|nr:hypothetical protein [Saccharothrix sp. ST-888]KJK56112.1 hypothetical protein UK12_24540 [Saccharothrix sp. ST-888]